MDGNSESRGANGSEASPGFEGLSAFSSWEARTAHPSCTPFPVLLSSFIWVGVGGEWKNSPAFLPERRSPRVGPCRAVTSLGFSPPFPPSSLHPGVVGRVGWGGAAFFFFRPLRLPTEKDTFSRAGGEAWRWLASRFPGGRRKKVTLQERKEDRRGERGC